MKKRVLLPSSRYIIGFKNKEERIVQRAYQDFFYSFYEGEEDVKLYQRAFCKAIVLVLYTEEEISMEDDFKAIIKKELPTHPDNYMIEEVELKFRDDDLLLLQLYLIQNLSKEVISQRLEISTSDVTKKVEHFQNLWGENQDMSLTEYLLQIEKRQWYKRLLQNPIPLKQKENDKNRETFSIGKINKLDTSFWGKIKSFFK